MRDRLRKVREAWSGLNVRLGVGVVVLLVSASPAVAATPRTNASGIPNASPNASAPGHGVGLLVLGWFLWFVLLLSTIGFFQGGLALRATARGHREGGVKGPLTEMAISLGLIVMVFVYVPFFNAIVEPIKQVGF